MDNRRKHFLTDMYELFVVLSDGEYSTKDEDRSTDGHIQHPCQLKYLVTHPFDYYTQYRLSTGYSRRCYFKEFIVGIRQRTLR